jgi:hypothetical protein
VSTPPTHKLSLGIRAFWRFALFTLFSLSFLALAVVDYSMGAPWVVVVAYLFSAGILGMLASKMFPKRVRMSRPQQPKTGAPQRSGNPAVRAQHETTRRPGKDATGH